MFTSGSTAVVVYWVVLFCILNKAEELNIQNPDTKQVIGKTKTTKTKVNRKMNFNVRKLYNTNHPAQTVYSQYCSC